jgi:hypothetical protein
MSGFDPWAVLAEIRGRDPAPPASDTISRISGFSRDAPLKAENENPAPARLDWPDGVDYWLTLDAVTLAGILNMGGSYRWCPTGGLDMWREDGRFVGFGPHKIAALRAAGLLPGGLAEHGRGL